jgi:hypothetical protein
MFFPLDRTTDDFRHTGGPAADIVSKAFGVATADLFGTSRKRPLPDARAVYAFLLRLGGLSINRAAACLGCEHSTISQNVARCERLEQVDDLFRRRFRWAVSRFDQSQPAEGAVLTVREKREFLARVMRTPIPSGSAQKL